MEKHILQEQIDQGYSQAKIAQNMNCCQSTVRYWLTKYNLKTNRNRYNKGHTWAGTKGEKPHLCYLCGETDPNKFYGKRKNICGRCHNQEVKKYYKAKREKWLDYLGGKCVVCGYDTYPCSLATHHLDPDKKDPNFNTARHWSFEKIKKELDKCVLACHNCHAAIHAGHISVKKTTSGIEVEFLD